MTATQPREGDHTSDWQKQGYTVSLTGELRTPGGHSVSGWNGPLTSQGGTIKDKG